MAHAALTPLLPDPGPSTDRSRLRAALAADPALTGRVSVDRRGRVILTGPRGGPAPVSFKGRRRWELHVRLRLAAEFATGPAWHGTIRWAHANNEERR